MNGKNVVGRTTTLLAVVAMRLHWPKTEPPSILPPGKGTWSPPKVVVAD